MASSSSSAAAAASSSKKVPLSTVEEVRVQDAERTLISLPSPAVEELAVKKVDSSDKGGRSRKRIKKMRSHAEIIAAADTMKLEREREAIVTKRARKPNSRFSLNEGYFNQWEDDEKVNDYISRIKNNKQGSQHNVKASKKRKSVSKNFKEEVCKKTRNVESCSENFMIGHRINIWWPKDNVFYPGEITSFDHEANMYEVLYDDGDVEMLNLEKEKWELLNHGEETVSGLEVPLVAMLSETKRKIAGAVKAAKYELKHRKAARGSARKNLVEANKFFEVMNCVTRKIEDDILENDALLGR